MPRYFFDTRDGADVVRDDEGQELDGIKAARDEATRGLADLAHEAIPGAFRRELAVDVRDLAGHALLTVALWFEVATLTG